MRQIYFSKEIIIYGEFILMLMTNSSVRSQMQFCCNFTSVMAPKIEIIINLYIHVVKL